MELTVRESMESGACLQWRVPYLERKPVVDLVSVTEEL